MPSHDKTKYPKWRLADGTMLVPGMSVMTRSRRVGVTDALFVKQWEEFADTFDGTVKVNFLNSDSVLHETHELVSLGTEPTPMQETQMPTSYPPLDAESPDEITQYGFFHVPLDPAAVIPDSDKWLFIAPFRYFREGQPKGLVRRRFAELMQTLNGDPLLVGRAQTPCKAVLVARTATTSYTPWQIKENG